MSNVNGYILNKIKNKNTYKNFCFFMIGLFINTLSINLFYIPNNVVSTGSTGLAILINNFIDIPIPLIVFVISSIGLIFLTKPLVKKLNKTDDTIATNAYSVIGKKAIVTQDINPTLGYGQIKVNGETWSAKTISDNIIPKDSEVIIKNIEGVKAVVELLNEKVNV